MQYRVDRVSFRWDGINNDSMAESAKSPLQNVTKNEDRVDITLRRCRDEAHKIIEGYISGLPKNAAMTIPAAALRRWWAFRFGEPYRMRIIPSKCVGNKAVDLERSAFAEHLSTYGNIAEETTRNRVSAIKLFLYQSFPDDLHGA